MVAEKLSAYEFANFLVGTTVPQSLLDREDEIRSALRIRGREGLKTQITRTIGKKVSQITGKKVEYARPDLTVLVPLGNEPITITPRSIWISARYIKRERGISQKSKTCNICSGLGCASCDFRGVSTSSIQSIATEFFSRVFKAEGCNFIWIGGEDENHLVLGEGRHFFVEVVKPKKRSYTTIPSTNSKRMNKPRKRHLLLGREIRASANASTGSPSSVEIESSQGDTSNSNVEFKSIEILPSKPTRIPMFKMDCEVHLVRQAKEEEGIVAEHSLIDASAIEKEFSGTKVSVQVSRKFKRVPKFIESTKVTQAGGDKLTLRIKCDGGIPIKKLVSSNDDSVTPNISTFLKGYVIDQTMPFDILGVTLIQEERPVQSVLKRHQFSHRQAGNNRGRGIRSDRQLLTLFSKRRDAGSHERAMIKLEV